MPTRRQAIIGAASVAAGSGAVLSAGAFTSSVSAGADMRVVVVSDLRLRPAREEAETGDEFEHVEEGEHPYVDTDDAGDVDQIVIEHLNRRAFTDFGQIVEIVNEGNVGYDKLTFEFSSGEDSDPDPADVMGIVSDAETVESEGGAFIIEEDLDLEPGDSITFGVTVDLLPDSEPGVDDLPDSGVDLELGIVAERLE